MPFKTLSELRSLVRQKADIENDGNHISDPEVDSYINQSIEMLQSMLVDGTDGTLFAKNAPDLVSLGDNSYQLPDDFSQLVSVDVIVANNPIRSVQADPQAYAQLSNQVYNGVAYTRHLLRWNTQQGRAELFVFPAPSDINKLTVQYIPEPPTLSLDSDTLNYPTFWYQWVVLDAAVACLVKEESNPGSLMIERDKVEKRLRDHIRSMTPTRVKTIRKTSRDDPNGSRFALPSVNYRGG